MEENNLLKGKVFMVKYKALLSTSYTRKGLLNMNM